MLNEEELEEIEEKNQKKEHDKFQELESKITSENISNSESEAEFSGEWYEQEWYEKIEDDKSSFILNPEHTPVLLRYKAYSYQQKLHIISPYYDYLDTEERMIIEYFEERISKYSEILETLNKRAEFKNF